MTTKDQLIELVDWFLVGLLRRKPVCEPLEHGLTDCPLPPDACVGGLRCSKCKKRIGWTKWRV